MHFRKPTFFSLSVAFLFCCFFLSGSTSAHATTDSTKKHQKRVVRHVRTKRRHIQAKKEVERREVKLNMPPPGHDGEERSDWFMRRRAWPNETIDPEMYPNALAQAAKMPVLDHMGGGKHSIQATFTWQPIGPYSIDGRVSCIATHPTDSNTFYVGAAAGGLWKTTDHGTSWRCVTDTFGSLSIGCVAIDPVEPNTIYIGLGECNYSADSYPGDGLWKSTDAGATWVNLGFAKAQYIGKIAFDPHDHTHVFIAVPGSSTASDSTRGIFRSNDGGATWIRALTPRLTKSRLSTSVGCIDVAINPLNSAEIVAYAWDHSLPLASGFSSGPTGPGTGIWRSIDTGNTWARIDTTDSYGLPNGYKTRIYGRGALLWTADGAQNYLYAAVTRRDTNIVTHYPTDVNFYGLYRSTDDGVTWQKTIDSTIKMPMGGVQGKDSANIMNAQGDYNLYLAANPLRPSEVYLGGIDVFRSTDHGASFKDISRSYSDYYVKGNREQHSDQHGLAFTASKSGEDMIVVSDGGVFHTSDFGATWSQTTGLPITMFYGIEPWRAGMANTGPTINASDLKLYGGTQDNGTVGHGLTSDTAFDWINHGDGGIAASHPTNANDIISSLQLGVIFARNSLDSIMPTPLSLRDTTHDSRPRWHTLSNRLLRGANALTDTNEACAFIAPVVLDEQHPTELYTGRTHIYRAVLDWNDPENVTWYKWSPPIAGDTTNPSKWYYGDVETIALGLPDAAGHRMVWAGGYSSGFGSSLFRTVVDPTRPANAAPRWIGAHNGISGNVSDIVPDRSDSLTAFITVSSGGNFAHVMRTTDGGAHWTNISGNLPSAPVSALVIDTLAEHGDASLKNQILIAGTDVGVYVTTNGGTQWLQLGNNLPHVIVGDLKVYKNMLIAATHGRSLYAMDISQLQPGALSVHSEESSKALQAAIYPNPILEGGQLHIQAANMEHAISCTLINEASGRTITLAIQQQTNSLLAIVPKEIASGSYLIEVRTSEGIVARGRISVIH